MSKNLSALPSIKSKVAEMVTPTAEERAAVDRIAREVCTRAEAAAERHGIRVRAEIEGSVAKDTWIASDRDLDVFIIFPEGTPIQMVKGKGLEIAKEAAGKGWKLGYAEHPYVEGNIKGFRVDIVPSIEMRKGDRPTTSVDRTPLHTDFVKSKADSTLRSEIRILKQFMKGIGVYGAELRVGGFSGYLCELLVLGYGSFEGVLKAVSRWKEGEVVEVAGGAAQKSNMKGTLLYVPDPVDLRRNAAAAVTANAYASFIAASRAFLGSPDEKFFFPPRPKISSADLVKMLNEKESLIMGISFKCPAVPSDILWGELNKSLSRMAKAIEGEGFQVLDSAAWSDEAEIAYFLFELDRATLPNWRSHTGPMVYLAAESDNFLSKYLKNEDVVSGPYIRGSRWCVDLRRRFTSIEEIIRKDLPRMGISKHVADSLSRGFDLILGESLGTAASSNKELLAYLYDFVRKKPAWLQ
uniref:CCA-adding enzyme n=1 Tax=Candidatus Methanomethylicus mesodigestus TaxID=1867258 RepID=A0A7C3J2K0_9CREN